MGAGERVRDDRAGQAVEDHRGGDFGREVCLGGGAPLLRFVAGVCGEQGVDEGGQVAGPAQVVDEQVRRDVGEVVAGPAVVDVVEVADGDRAAGQAEVLGGEVTEDQLLAGDGGQFLARLGEHGVPGGAEAEVEGVVPKPDVALGADLGADTAGRLVDAAQRGAEAGHLFWGGGAFVEVLVVVAPVREDVGEDHGVGFGVEGQHAGEDGGACGGVEVQGAALVGDQGGVGAELRDPGEAAAADLEDHALLVAVDAEDVADVAAGGGLDAGEVSGVAAAVGQDGGKAVTQQSGEGGQVRSGAGGAAVHRPAPVGAGQRTGAGAGCGVRAGAEVEGGDGVGAVELPGHGQIGASHQHGAAAVAGEFGRHLLPGAAAAEVVEEFLHGAPPGGFLGGQGRPGFCGSGEVVEGVPGVLLPALAVAVVAEDVELDVAVSARDVGVVRAGSVAEGLQGVEVDGLEGSLFDDVVLVPYPAVALVEAAARGRERAAL